MNIAKSAAAMIALLLFSSNIFAYIGGDGLALLVSSKQPIKVFVKGFVNETGKSDLSMDKFKSVFETALLNRKSVKFVLLDSPEGSDVTISGTLKNYLYSDTDPITTYASPAGFVLDAVTTENYVEMRGDFVVTDTKSGKVLWQDTLNSFIKKMMTPDESVELIFDKLARTFLWKSFGKPK